MKLGPILAGIQGSELSPADCEQLLHPSVGGVVLFARNFQSRGQLLGLCQQIAELRSPRLLLAVDQEGGRVQRLTDGYTCLPPPGRLGQLFAKSKQQALDYAYRHGRVMATEILLSGIDLSFAPVLDLDRGSCVIGDRALAADPQVVIQLAEAYLAGMRDAGMKSTGKHFPGHGSVGPDSHVDEVCDQRPMAELEANDLQPFKALASQLDAIMMAHVVYPAVDQQAAGYSAHWINTVLRGRLGFQGTVFSDDLGMFAARVAGGLVERARLSLAAGCDAALICNPAEVQQFLGAAGDDWPDAGPALQRLYGHSRLSYEQLTMVPEWQQWTRSLEAMVT